MQEKLELYTQLLPLKMKPSQNIECDCPNLYYNTLNEGWIKYMDFYLQTLKQVKYI